MRETDDFRDLRELANRLANPFGHPSQVRTQVLVFANLRRLAVTCESVWPGIYRERARMYSRLRNTIGDLRMAMEK